MSAKINLCLVVNNFDPGGLERVVINLINNIEKEQFNVFFICIDGEGRLFDQLSPDIKSYLILKKNSHYNVSFIWKIKKFLKKHSVQIVHAHNLGPLVFTGIACKFFIRKRPVVIYTEHNQVYSLDYAHKMRFKHIYLKLTDHIVTCSKQLQRFLRNSLQVTREITVIHNGIESKYLGGNRTKISEGNCDAARVMVIGTAVIFSQQKGLIYLIEAAREVCRQQRNIHFVIAGDGPLKEELEGMVDKYDLGEFVKFPGYKKDIVQLLESLDVYVLSSLWEGLPLSLLEALAAGKPIIATNVGGNPEIVKDGVNGILVPPKNGKALAEAILKLYEATANDFQKTFHLNQLKFKSCFSLERMIENYSNFYKSHLVAK